MTRPPPRSTLFPYRRSSDLVDANAVNRDLKESAGVHALEAATMRSEEHTSELQSRGHLVCRLLLEKKNTIALMTMSQWLLNPTLMIRILFTGCVYMGASPIG